MFNFENFDLEIDCKSKEQIQFLESNVLQLGAIGWMGYELKNRGAIIICQWSANRSLRMKNAQVEVHYLSSQEIAKMYPRDRELQEFVREYNPEDSLAITFVNSQNSLLDSYHLTLTVSALQCYVLWLEKILELDVKR